MAATRGLDLVVKVSGAAVPFVAEEFATADDQTYTIADSSLIPFDPTAAITVYDGGMPVDPVADPYTVNRLTGQIVFETVDALRDITADCSSLPLSEMAHGTALSFKCDATVVDDSEFGDADVTMQSVARDWSGTVTRWQSTDAYLATAYAGTAPVIVEVSLGATKAIRGWALFNTNAFSGSRKTMVEETAGWQGSADADGRSHSWLI